MIAQSDFARQRLDGLVYHPVLHGPHYAKKLLVLTGYSGDVGAARRQIARLTGHEWTERQAEEYQRELDQIPPVRSSLAQRLRRRLSPFVTRMRDAVDAARRR